ncbi:MAG: hypothetical protein FJ398_22535 [Verrucomicrobia bacterium]|nr:hypothetical protein [Verrucomicrobiota bacterium]
MKALLLIPPLLVSASSTLAAAKAIRPVVEVEEDVYTFTPANNGAGPMWCAGSTCLVRVGEHVFASGLETIPDAKPLNNCRWMLFKREPSGWEKVCVEDTGRTREPSPMAAFADGRLFLSANPTLASPSHEGGGPARPEILAFSAINPKASAETLLPGWKGNPRFSEHSYRSLAADASNRELILFQNIDYTHAEWAFLDRDAKWSAQGQLRWPWGAEYDKPQPIRICYPNIALQNRAAYFCGVSDIVEPNLKWRDFKKQLTGRDWDYDFRRLFFTWTPDITREGFRDWIEIASREQTAGWLFPADLWVAPDGAVHLLWTERAIDDRLREKFFPAARQSHSLNYALVRDGQVVSRRSLLRTGDDGLRREIPSAARFQITPENRLFVFYYVHGHDATGKAVSENRLIELEPAGLPGPTSVVRLKAPFTSFFTATPRAGSPPSNTLELLGQQAGKPQTISYARIRLGS